jgi:hypothetical protein
MEQESQIKLSKSILFVLPVTLLALLLTDIAFAQVATSAANKVNQTLNGFLYVVMSVGIVLFTAALVLAGYKFAFVEGTKFADLKGVLIGGVLFGAAGAIASFLVTGA